MIQRLVTSGAMDVLSRFTSQFGSKSSRDEASSTQDIGFPKGARHVDENLVPVKPKPVDPENRNGAALGKDEPEVSIPGGGGKVVQAFFVGFPRTRVGLPIHDCPACGVVRSV